MNMDFNLEDFNLEEKTKINNALKEAGVSNTCPRCNNDEFVFVKDMLYSRIGCNNGSPFGLLLPTVPVVVTVCAKCGFISQHALGVLELLQHKGEKK